MSDPIRFQDERGYGIGHDQIESLDDVHRARIRGVTETFFVYIGDTGTVNCVVHKDAPGQCSHEERVHDVLDRLDVLPASE